MAKKEPMKAYKVINGEMVEFHVINNRQGASTAYKVRRANVTEGGWYSEHSSRILWTKAEAKQKAIDEAQSNIDWHTKQLALDKKRLKNIRALKVK